MRSPLVAVSALALALLLVPFVDAHSCATSGTVSFDLNHQTCPSILADCIPGHLCVNVAGVDPRILP